MLAISVLRKWPQPSAAYYVGAQREREPVTSNLMSFAGTRHAGPARGRPRATPRPLGEVLCNVLHQRQEKKSP